MATSNIDITGNYTEVVGDVLANSSYNTIRYVVANAKPDESVIGTKLPHNGELDLRTFLPLKVYVKSNNGRVLNATLITGLPLIDSNGSGGQTSDRELVVTTYMCKTAFTGSSVGDIITQTQVVDVTATPSTVNVLWRNQTTSTDLASAPDGTKLSLVGTGSTLTDLQLRATAINVNIQNSEVEVKNDANNPLSVTVGNEVEVKNTQGTSLDVNITNESINVNVSEVEITNDVGSPIPVAITNIPEVEITNDEGNPIPVSHNGLTNTELRSLPVTIKGVYDRWRDSFERDDETLWTKSIAPDDGYNIRGSTQGAGYGQLSKSALTRGSTSKLISKNQFSMPVRLGYGMSLSQRIHGEIYTIDMVSVDPITGLEIVSGTEDNADVINVRNILSLSITSNVATIIFTSNHNFKYDDLVVIYGANDTRVNVVSRISAIVNKRCIQLPLTIANATYNIGSNCFIGGVNLSNGNGDIAGMCYIDITNTNAIYYHRAQGSGIITSPATSFGSSLTDALIPSSQPYTFNLQPRYASEILAAIDVLRFGANPIDNNAVGVYYKRTQVVPSVDAKYAMRLRATTLPNKAVPLEINTAVKTGTTTATVTTVKPHGLATGAYVRCYGASNQTIWTNLTTETVITVTGPNTFTLVWGTAVTATLYGGMVIPVNGTGSITGAVNIGLLGATWANGRLFIGTTATPALVIGDTIRLVNVKDATGNVRNNLTGRFRVNALTPNILEGGIGSGAGTTASSPTVIMADTSAIVIGAVVVGTGIPVGASVISKVDNVSITLSANATSTGNTWLTLQGMVVEPLDFNAPANEQPTTNISAGGVIKDTDLRMNFVRCLDYTRTPVEITGGHTTGDQQLAAPVNVVNTTQVAQGTASSLNAQVVGNIASGSAISGNPLATGGRTVGNLTRNILTGDAGDIAGPGEICYNGWAFTAASATPTDGTSARTLQAPVGRDCEVYLGITTAGTSPTIQVEGSFDNINFSVIPMQRVDVIASANQYAQLAAWTPVTNAVYKGKTYGYPFVRIHQTGGTAFTTIAAVRFIPMSFIPTEVTSPFTLSAVNTTEAVGTSAGALQSGGVRTLAIPVKGSSKVKLVLDAFTYGTAAPTASTLVVEGTTDNVTWTTIPLQPIQGGPIVNSITSVGALNQWLTGIWEGDASSYNFVRVRWSAYTAGTATTPYYHGALKIIPIESNNQGNVTKATYRVTVSSAAPITTNYVLAAIEASATKTIRLKRLTIWNPGVFTAAQLSSLEIVRTTVASTAGTVVVPSSSGIGDPAYGGICRINGATITAGTSLWKGSYFTPQTLGASTPFVVDFTNNNTLKGIEIAAGITNGIAILHNTGSAGGASLSYTIEFTEE